MVSENVVLLSTGNVISDMIASSRLITSGPYSHLIENNFNHIDLY